MEILLFRYVMINRYESEPTPGDSEGQGSLVCGSPWGRKELDATEHHHQRQSQTGLEETPKFYDCGLSKKAWRNTETQTHREKTM